MHEDDDVEEARPREHFTDDELAFLRHAQYGELPARVRPEELVESQETDAPRAAPEDFQPDRWPGRLGGAT